jgi:dipeptidyl aminopeptidase/acylaminoacyl peptidase
VNKTTILFLSNRTPSGLTQLFQLNLPNDMTSVTDYIEPIQITDFPLSIDNLLINQQASRLAFSCQVYANLSIEETAAQQAAEKSSGSLVYKFDKLFIRHWDEYMLGPRHHPFIVSIAQNPQGTFQFTSTPTDVLFGVDSDSPTRPFGDGRTQWSFSATANKFAFTRQHDETSAVAWSTNLDIYTVDLTTPNMQPVCITCDNLAADTDPKYSPTDENTLVYRSQSVPGYESDQFKVKLYNGTSYSFQMTFSRIFVLGSDIKTTLLDSWDRSIQVVTWSVDGQSLFLELGEEASNVIYRFSDISDSTSVPIRLMSAGSSHDVNPHPTNNETFVFTHESITEPPNIYLYTSTLGRAVTDHNNNLLAKVTISKVVEKFSFQGAENETVWGWHVQPANGTAQKAPLAFLIHGGPQSSWYDAWSYRWNYQAFAAEGYAVIAINFHGSDSYGQKFTDSITGQYGTLPYEDLQLGLTEALRLYPYIDGNRAAALGASYGGFMINWIAGHPDMSQRFKTLVCHDGLFDMRGMAYSTEELWFSEHDAGGFTPYDNPEAFEEFNPVNHVANWTQPMLIIHGGRDYRVPDTQGISAFTALQRRGIPSRLIYLPNENHWTLNTFNSLIWYQEVLHWMYQWTN